MKEQKEDNIIADPQYLDFIMDIKNRVYQGQSQALRAVNKELIGLYWDIGRMIVEKQEELGWGKSVVEQMSSDLSSEFPGIKGFSSSNLWRMRSFYKAYLQVPILASLSRELPWFHNILLFEKVKEDLEREFYLKFAIKNNLSYRALHKAIEQNEYHRYLANQTNFDLRLDENQALKANMAVKDDYNLDFLTLSEEHKERELEDAIIANITKFLSEMGGQFAFVGRQYKIIVSEDEYFIDLLFYHRKLQCLVAIELKAGKFDPRDIGQLNFYLSALDDQSKESNEKNSIGIIICKEKDRTKVEYSLRNVNSPIGVGTYDQYSKLADVPEMIAKYLPSEEEIKRRLVVEDNDLSKS